MSDKLFRREVIGAALATGALLKNSCAQTAPPANPPKEVPSAIAPGSVIGKDVTFKSGDAEIKAYFAQPAKHLTSSVQKLPVNTEFLLPKCKSNFMN